jgi:hypothetical protein
MQYFLLLIDGMMQKMGPEGLGRKNFKIETQSIRPERRNIGYNVLESIKKMMQVQLAQTHPGKMKHDLFKRGSVLIHRQMEC